MTPPLKSRLFDAMEDLPGISWIWRGLRGRSVTFAALFALSLLGFSVIAPLRHLLSWMNAPLLAWLLLPAFLIGVLAKKELEWIPDEQRRLKWARGLIFGSIVAAVLIALLLPTSPAPAASPAAPERPTRHGPPARR